MLVDAKRNSGGVAIDSFGSGRRRGQTRTIGERAAHRGKVTATNVVMVAVIVDGTIKVAAVLPHKRPERCGVWGRWRGTS
jgi:hypothetical protein